MPIPRLRPGSRALSGRMSAAPAVRSRIVGACRAASARMATKCCSTAPGFPSPRIVSSAAKILSARRSPAPAATSSSASSRRRTRERRLPCKKGDGDEGMILEMMGIDFLAELGEGHIQNSRPKARTIPKCAATRAAHPIPFHPHIPFKLSQPHARWNSPEFDRVDSKELSRLARPA